MDVNSQSLFYIDKESCEFRYDGNHTGLLLSWKSLMKGVMNVNAANTNYNHQKGNTVDVYGRYGMMNDE